MDVKAQRLLPPANARKSSEGYSLIETMIAMMFMLVVLLGLAQGMLVSQGMNVNGKNTTQGLAISQRIIEEIQGRYGQTLSDYNSLAVTDSNAPVTKKYSLAGEIIEDNAKRPAFVVTETVTLDPSPDPSYKLVTVTVTPQREGFGKVKPVSLETYLIKPQT